MSKAAKILLSVAVLMAASAPAPTLADNVKTPPGNPCLKNNGNPCNGNNGNIGQQGNSGHEKTKIDKKPPPITMTMPNVKDRGVFITQVGDGNTADVKQSATNAYANIMQNGALNDADVAQAGTGSDYIQATQTGDQNFARLQQSGSGKNLLYTTQTGTGNWIWSDQVAAGAIFNGARLTQTGNDNDMVLHQNGSDNLAVLTQEGDDNGMTATQTGVGNRLTWIQQGTGLSDLQISQTGGSQSGGQLLITQTGTGSGN